MITLVQAQPPARPAVLRLADGIPWIVGLEIPAGDGVAFWRRDVVRRYEAALETMRGDRAVSFLPVLDQVEPSPWSLLLGVRDLGIDADVVPADLVDAPLYYLALGTVAALLDRSVSAPIPTPATTNAVAVFERFLDYDGMPLRRHVTVQQASLDIPQVHAALLSKAPTLVHPEVQGEVPPPLPFVKWNITPAPVADAEQRVRLGALDLDFPSGAPTLKNGEIKVWLETGANRLPRRGVHVDVQLNLDLASFTPGSQDTPEVEQTDSTRARPKPLLIPLSLPGPALGLGTAAPKLSMIVTETAYPGDRQKLAIGLGLPADSTLPGRPILVLDSTPFMVMRVDMPALVPSGESAQLAAFYSDSVEGAVWKIQARRQGYTLLLPPQGIGEAAVKGRVTSTDPGLVDDAYADFRFSPPARLQVYTTYRGSEQGTVEPPTNTRRIFGDASQRAPGAPLRASRFELLYGMTATVQREDVVVVELTADLGLVPRRLPKSPNSQPGDRYSKFKELWDRICEGFAARLGVLTLRQLGPLAVGQDAVTPPPALSDGVTFELRPSADIRRPVPMPPQGVVPNSPYGPGQRPNGDNALRGGADWGFESTEVYESVWRRPRSNAGELADVSWSPLGGWGYQRALFDNRRTTIISRGVMGRTHFYSLQRVGRVAVFWSRAKHVIVYERTVLPGEQFDGQPPQEGPGQPRHEGRPVLRKVREYVQILQPERRFPERGAARVAAGCVQAIRFRSTIIPVDSAWGEDIVGEGWRVPLWRPGHGDAYPRPQVELELASDPESGLGTVRCSLSEPDQLWFFTNTRDGFDDQTDAWPSVESVDYVDYPRPAAPPPSAPTSVPGDLDARLPDAAPVEAGFHAFTFPLHPLVERPANVMAERGNATVGVVLRNVTMMRSQARAAGNGSVAATIGRVLGLSASLDAGVGSVRDIVRSVGPGAVSQDVRARVQKAVRDLSTVPAFADLKAALDNLETTAGAILAGNPCEVLRQRIQDEMRQVGERVNKEIRGARTKLLDDVRGVGADVTQARQYAERLTRGWFDTARLLLSTARTPVESLGGVMKQARNFSLEQELSGVLDDVKYQVGLAGLREIATFDAACKRWRTSLFARFDEVAAAIATPLLRRLPAAAGTLAAAARSARRKVSTVLTTETEALRAKVVAGEELTQTIVNAAIDRVAQAAVSAAQSVDLVLKDAENQFDVGLAPLRAGFDDIHTQLDVLENALIGALGQVGGGANQLFTKIEDVLSNGITVGTKKIPGIDALVARLNDGQSPDGVVNLASQAVNQVCQGVIGDSLGALKTAVKTLQQIDRALDTLAQEIGASATARAMADDIEAFVREHGDTLASYTTHAVDWARGAAHAVGGLSQIADSTLRLFRAFGDAPRVPALDFNRTQIAYYFDEARRSVDITPVTALVDRLGQELKSFGIRLPTTEIAERLIPKIPADFSISDIFPDFAGLRLDGLFQNLTFPSLDRDRVKVTHCYDKETRRSYLDAAVDGVRLPVESPVFSLGPVSLTLFGGCFTAQARLEAGLQGVQKHVRGEILGDWALGFGGQTLVTFRSTPLTFDENGHLRFDIHPDRVALSGPVSFLDTFVNSLGGEAGGVKISPVKDGAIPVGVECLLDLPIPPLTFGAFGVSGLRFTTGMQLRALPDFEITTAIALGSRREPFTITRRSTSRSRCTECRSSARTPSISLFGTCSSASSMLSPRKRCWPESPSCWRCRFPMSAGLTCPTLRAGQNPSP